MAHRRGKRGEEIDVRSIGTERCAIWPLADFGGGGCDCYAFISVNEAWSWEIQERRAFRRRYRKTDTVRGRLTSRKRTR